MRRNTLGFSNPGLNSYFTEKPGLSVKPDMSRIFFLGVDEIGLVFDVMIPFFILKHYAFSLENFSNTGFKDHCIVDACYSFRFKDCFEFNTSVGKMGNDGQIVFLLPPFFNISCFNFLMIF